MKSFPLTSQNNSRMWIVKNLIYHTISSGHYILCEQEFWYYDEWQREFLDDKFFK